MANVVNFLGKRHSGKIERTDFLCLPKGWDDSLIVEAHAYVAEQKKKKDELEAKLDDVKKEIKLAQDHTEGDKAKQEEFKIRWRASNVQQAGVLQERIQLIEIDPAAIAKRMGAVEAWYSGVSIGDLMFPLPVTKDDILGSIDVVVTDPALCIEQRQLAYKIHSKKIDDLEKSVNAGQLVLSGIYFPTLKLGETEFTAERLVDGYSVTGKTSRKFNAGYYTRVEIEQHVTVQRADKTPRITELGVCVYIIHDGDPVTYELKVKANEGVSAEKRAVRKNPEEAWVTMELGDGLKHAVADAADMVTKLYPPKSRLHGDDIFKEATADDMLKKAIAASKSEEKALKEAVGRFVAYVK